jgi:uncharacterized membrane protein YcaP (DUF421 family)
MELHAIAVRCLFAYLFLLLITRLRGKAGVAQATPFDFVLALILGDMIDDLLWSEVEAAKFVVGCGTLVLTDVLLSFAAQKSNGLRQLLEGSPRILMESGARDRRALRLEQIAEVEFEALLRLEGYGRERFDEVDKAIIEVSGGVSVLPKDEAREVQKWEASQLRKLKHV